MTFSINTARSYVPYVLFCCLIDIVTILFVNACVRDFFVLFLVDGR